MLDAVEDETCHSLKNERERRFSVTNDEFTLSDCVQMLTEPEVLDQSNAWYASLDFSQTQIPDCTLWLL